MLVQKCIRNKIHFSLLQTLHVCLTYMLQIPLKLTELYKVKPVCNPYGILVSESARYVTVAKGIIKTCAFRFTEYYEQ